MALAATVDELSEPTAHLLLSLTGPLHRLLHLEDALAEPVVFAFRVPLLGRPQRHMGEAQLVAHSRDGGALRGLRAGGIENRGGFGSIGRRLGQLGGEGPPNFAARWRTSRSSASTTRLSMRSKTTASAGRSSQPATCCTMLRSRVIHGEVEPHAVPVGAEDVLEVHLTQPVAWNLEGLPEWCAVLYLACMSNLRRGVIRPRTVA